MKRMVIILLVVLLVAAAIAGWIVFGPATYFSSKEKFIYIPTKQANKEYVLQMLHKDSISRHPAIFIAFADKLNYWQQVKPGKYKIESGYSNFQIVRLLRNGQQSPVNLIITKLRTKEDLASLAGKKFESDSVQFIHYLNNQDSLKKYDLDSNTVMTMVFPNTYTYFWNTPPDKIFSKLYSQYKTFWTPEKISLAKEKGLTPQSAYILSSIVEEETNKQDEKGRIASVYLNRLDKGMRLGADPTVKFALKDFNLKRIYNKHLSTESPYNTYRVMGLPPGPICTPSASTIDAVLKSPKTDYLYFVAKSDFSGYHTFAVTYEEHLKYAREYQEALNAYTQKLKPAEDNLDK